MVIWEGAIRVIVDVRRSQPTARILAITNDPRVERVARLSGADVVIPVREADADYVCAIAEPGLSPIAAGAHSQIELTATVSADGAGLITRASPYFAELVAADSSRALIGAPLQSLFAREDHGESVLSRLSPAMTLRNIEIEIVRADRSRGWVLLTLRKTKDGAKIHGVAVDITDLAQAWQGLARSEARYQSLFDASPIPIWEVDLRPSIGLIERVALHEPEASRTELAAMVIGAIRLVHANDYARKCSQTDPADDPAVMRAMVRMAGAPNGQDLLDQVELFANTAGPLCVPAVGRDALGRETRVSVTWNAPIIKGARDFGRTVVAIAPANLWA